MIMARPSFNWLRSKFSKFYLLLVGANCLTWLAAFFVCRHYPILLSVCLLAYGFGLRHGLDADHVAAIDGATRKLIEKSDKQATIGFFFSLGHSTVVIILSILVAITAVSIHNYFPTIDSFGKILGGFFSVFFLSLFSISNFVIFCAVVNKIRLFKKRENIPVKIKTGGVLSKFLHPLLKVVTKNWHMYFIGFLFGLGFDTATEVALLGISADSVVRHISFWNIMIFPALFTAGMCLVDTASGLLILKACRWAYINSVRKLYYNLVITLLSFLTAFIIAGYELLGFIGNTLNLTCDNLFFINLIDNHFEFIGAFIVFVFVATWLLSKLNKEFANIRYEEKTRARSFLALNDRRSGRLRF